MNLLIYQLTLTNYINTNNLPIIYINISWHPKCKTDESISSHLTSIYRDPWNLLRRNSIYTKSFKAERNI